MDLVETGKLEANLDIVNMIFLHNFSILNVKVGSIEKETSGETKLTIDQEAIVWPTLYKEVGEFIYFLN